MPRIIALSNQKGGVGKTTTTVSLAGALAGHLGLSTLVIDMDAQRNATRTILGSNVTPTENVIAMYETIHEAGALDCCRP